MGVRCFFSGVEGQQHFDAAVSAGAKNLLMSYLYIEKKKDMNVVRDRKKKNPNLRFLIDSGAHTFQMQWANPPYNTWKLSDYEDYLKRYVQWARANKDWVDAVVELDIDIVINGLLFGHGSTSEVGSAKVKEWQEKYFYPLEKEGIQVVYVWHKERKLEGFEEMCRKHSYVGLPGELSSEPDFNKYITIARRYTSRIHGFAASVLGESNLIIKQKGLIRQVTIEGLFSECTNSRTVRKNGYEETTAFLPRSTQTWSLTDSLKSSFEKVSCVIRHRAEKPIYKIRLRGGKVVSGTSDHSFFKLDRFGNLIETKPSDMKVGDHLVCSKGIPQVEASSPLTCEKDAEFLGIWFGDGYVGLRDDNRPSSIWVSKQHQPEILKICEDMARRHNCNWSMSKGTVDGYMTNHALATKIINWFGRVGDDKYLGSVLFSASESVRAAFLRGYFSADGSCKGSNRLISLSCFRRDLLEVVQLLLEHWDIRTSITDAGISGKGSHTWELAISDVESRKIFEDFIGFVQQDQKDALRAKNNTPSIAGCHRGLPVSLLIDPKRLTTRSGYNRSVYPKDRRTHVSEHNFCSKLIDMEAEYLEIVSLDVVSTEKVDVYDLEVPTTQRFFANGVLAHNTKQADFRDFPWFSIDSITWKTSEIYGTLIDWDDHKQKLTFEDNKLERGKYRQKFLDLGFDADAIIKDTNYKEVTRYALWSMRSMEEFYLKKYSHRTFYYEMRLPHPDYVKTKLANAEVLAFWAKFKPQDRFKAHADEKDPDVVRRYLLAISAVQYREDQLLQPKTQSFDFLKGYFPAFIDDTSISNLDSLQKEMANLLSPRNEPALLRTDRGHYVAMNNPPKRREEVEFLLEDLEHDVLSAPFGLKDLE